MELRITRELVGDAVTVCVHGRLAGHGVDELERSCRGVGRQVTLDLSNLHSVDTRGVELVRGLAAQGAELVGATPYLQLLLQRPRDA